ncbi:hypothetical protein F4775DRAFT_594273 [Biscogniauxia sp. FL1348]|nr:hypothetical protein F4775DRAFT_594273 [Biscogniauxia sp. FL1348]
MHPHILFALFSLCSPSAALPFFSWGRDPAKDLVARASVPYSVVPIDGSGSSSTQTVVETITATQTPITQTVVETSPPVTNTVVVTEEPTTQTVSTTVSVVDVEPTTAIVTTTVTDDDDATDDDDRTVDNNTSADDTTSVKPKSPKPYQLSDNRPEYDNTLPDWNIELLHHHHQRDSSGARTHKLDVLCLLLRRRVLAHELSRMERHRDQSRNLPVVIKTHICG